MNPLKWFFRAAGVVFVAFVLWQFVSFLLPRPAAFSDGVERAAQIACARAVATIEQASPDATRFGVAHILNDPHDQVTAALRSSLARRSGWSVEQGSVIQKFLEDASRALVSATSLEEVLHAGQKVELDVVMAGRVLAASATNDVARIELELLAYDVRRGEFLFRDKVSGEWKPGVLEKAALCITRISAVKRFLLWILFVASLPWVTMSLTGWALEKKDNTASAIVVGAYCVLDLLAALALTGFSVTGGRASLTLIGALIIAAAYSLWACEKIAARTR